MTARALAFVFVFTAAVLLQAVLGRNPSARASARPASVPAKSAAITVGGEPAVILTRPKRVNRSEPQFLGATILPGNGMNLLQIHAYFPGLGDIDVLNSPGLAEAKQVLESETDGFGNKSFSFGAAILLPYPNRILGKLLPGGKLIRTNIGGKMYDLPANWKGKRPGAELHAMHGLILSAHFQDVKYHNGPAESVVSAFFPGGNFDGHWPSKTDVYVRMVLRNEALDVFVTAKNVGDEKLPMAISFHPYLRLPSQNRTQVRLHVPALERVVVNNYDDVFPTGKIAAVKGTPYNFTAPQGAPLGPKLYLDDCFTDLQRDRAGNVVIRLIDPEAKYGLRLTALSPQVHAVQVYDPPDKEFVVIEPQFNLADPFNKKLWGDRNTGMDWLAPGQSVTWHVRLQMFVPGDSAPAKRK